MIVFSNFFKVLKRHFSSISIYVFIFLGFAVFMSSMGLKSTEFVPVKPSVAIINESDSKLADAFVSYIKENANVKEVDSSNVKDALFFREIEYVFYIDKDFSLSSKIKTEKIPDSTSSYYIEMIFNRYLNVVNTYLENDISLDDALLLIKDDLKVTSSINLVNDDSKGFMGAVYFFNFSNYAILAIAIYAISTIIMTFKKSDVNKRNRVSSMPYKRFNFELFLASSTLGVILFLMILLIGLIFFSEALFTINGLFVLINLIFFILSSIAFAFFIANMVKSKDSLIGVVNIFGMGSSFISGAFVPQAFLGAFVTFIAHLFPSYYFINNNNLVFDLMSFNFDTLTPYFFNLFMLIIFSILFLLLNNYFTKKNL